MMAHPDTLRDLLTRYEELHRASEQKSGSRQLQELEDTAYTLCVSTGTQTIDQALTAARSHIATHASNS